MFPLTGKFRSFHMYFRCLRKFPADLHSHESAYSGVYTSISNACGSFRLIYCTFPWIGKFQPYACTSAFLVCSDALNICDMTEKYCIQWQRSTKIHRAKTENKNIFGTLSFCSMKKSIIWHRSPKTHREKKREYKMGDMSKKVANTLACQKRIKTKKRKAFMNTKTIHTFY